MSETKTTLSPQEETDLYVSRVNKLIGELQQRPTEDFKNIIANTGLLNRYKGYKEQLFNLKEPRNPGGKYLNANQRREIEVAYNELKTLVDEDLEGAALSAEIASAGPYELPDDFDPAGDPTNLGREAWGPAIAVSQIHARDFVQEKRAAETKSDPPPPYSLIDPNPNPKI